jgi:hypothetical protein
MAGDILSMKCFSEHLLSCEKRTINMCFTKNKTITVKPTNFILLPMAANV